MMIKILLLICACLFVLTACATESPAQVVEAYFQAIIDDQPERLAELSCAAWEADALTAATSFRNTGATLDGMQCEANGEEAGYQIVQCQGRIVVVYQGEERAFPLTRYRVIQENNAWRMCGEAG
jgi:hypothetical protein